MTLKLSITSWISAVLLSLGTPTYSAELQQWIGSWYGGQIAFKPASDNAALHKVFVADHPENNVPPKEYVPSFANSTLRSFVHLTAGGDRLRLKFSNRYGRTPLKIGAVRVAFDKVSEKATFHGKPEITLPAGSTIMSDPVSFRTVAGSELAVSVFYPESLPSDITMHFLVKRNELTPGNTVDAAIGALSARTLNAVYFLAGVDVESSLHRGTIVVIGDSMTDCGLVICWPELLAQQLAKHGKQYGVLNAAIGSNRLLRNSQIPMGGESALVRFNRDVLNQPAIKYVILYEGINDIAGWFFDGFNPSSSPITAQEVIEGIQILAGRTHQRGLKFYVATLAPTGGATARGFYSPEKNAIREEVNAWIRTTKVVDGYIDFSRALADPMRPDYQNMELNVGDHLHANQAGQEALSRAIDLSLFE